MTGSDFMVPQGTIGVNAARKHEVIKKNIRKFLAGVTTGLCLRVTPAVLGAEKLMVSLTHVLH